MLQGFRSVINSIVGKVFFAILLATFALLGVGYGVRDLVLNATSSTDAASVGDAKITLDQLDRAYRRQLANLQRQLGPGVTPTPQQKQGLAQAALDQQIDDALYAEAASRMGIRVGDAMVRALIEKEPTFAGEDKKFDPLRFRTMLDNQGMTEASFIPLLRADIAKQILTNPIAGGAVAPKLLAEDIYRYRNQQRVAQTVTIPNSAATGVPSPSDADIQAYYQKHAVEFTAPEYRVFTVLPLTPELFAAEVKPIAEDDLRAAYAARQAEYGVPEKRKIDQVVVDDKATAEAILKATQGGKSLADAAKEATAGKSQPVSLDSLTRDQFPESLRDPVFAAAKGTASGPVQTPLGWHVFVVTDIQEGHEVQFDAVKDKLAESLRHDAEIDALSDRVDKIGDKLAGGAPMDQVAQGVGATPVKIGPVDAKGLPPAQTTGKPAAAPAQPVDPDWLATAFQLRSGETSQIETAKDGSYFAVRLDAITPPSPRPLADVRADVVAGWTAEQKAGQIAKRAADLTAKATAGTPMTQIATEAGVKMETTPAVTRDPIVARMTNPPPGAVIDAMFQLTKVGDVTSIATSDSQVIVRLTEIRPADPMAENAPILPVQQELSAEMRADTTAEYLAGLRQQFKVKINPQALETVAGQ